MLDFKAMLFNNKWQVDKISCIGKLNVHESVNSSNDASSIEVYPATDNLQQSKADNDVDVKVSS